ncbi:MAG: molybdopterin-dependent oxidoreductase, partial [Terriglobales bacterium]
TKAEGNPDHPVSRGKLCLRGQTSVQGLYNPDRIRQPRLRDGHGALRPVDWDTALARFRQELDRSRGNLVWVGQLETGSFDGLVRQWLAAWGGGTPHYYEYFSYDALRQACASSYGAAVVPTFHIEKARYIVSFGAEFLETYVSNVEYAGDFAATHSFGHTHTPARFLAIGPRLSLTAANADDWWAAAPGTEALLAQALLDLVRARLGRGGGAMPIDAVAQASGVASDLIRIAAERLVANRPSLVLGPGYATDSRSAYACQLAVNQINDLLGNTGVTVNPDVPHALSAVSTQAEIHALAQRAVTGQLGMLVLHHANPAYHHPQWGEQLRRAQFKVSFASWMDETTQSADLILPDHHYLEAWGDYSPRPGVTGVLQPGRIPVYDTRPTADLLLATLPGSPSDVTYAEWLKARWQAQLGSEPAWNALLQQGVTAAAAPGGAPPPRVRQPPATAVAAAAPARFDGEGAYQLVVFPSVQFFDGRQANRSWAQEIAEPLSKLAWDGWCELHPDTAAKFGAQPSDVIRITSPHGSREFPLFITTWIRPDCVGVLMGQGHSNFGMWANDCGENVHALQDPEPGVNGLWSAQTVRVTLQRTQKQHPLANLQQQHLQWDKQLALAVTVAEADTAAAQEPQKPISFYHFHHPYLHHRWAMAVDLSSCIGCNACQAACYAENNIAVMGRSSLRSHREMTWIRVEVYEGDAAHRSTQLSPDLRFLPMPCQQCDNAPCEYVCPVFAAYHTDEGLNGQVYNRCIGTRYCSNNCIYKVRRFNWYTPQWPDPLNQQLNPLVTVRAKGIMEKCTFCVQRIQAAELDARTNQPQAQFHIPDGTIQTACMQTCPTQAITFGDLLDPASQVARLSAQPRAYGLMAKENTYPAVAYLKRTKFELGTGSAEESGD